ncbi:hypothetical protein PINS_up002174 [Pythium insidiosum]|nr:hypothetical protein PINS_up002174 [Pythium insidiosum]
MAAMPRFEEREELLEISGNSSSGTESGFEQDVEHVRSASSSRKSSGTSRTLGGAMELLNEELRQEIAPRKLLRQFSLNIPPCTTGGSTTSSELQSARNCLPNAPPSVLGDVLDRLGKNQIRWRQRGSSDSLAEMDKNQQDDSTLTSPLAFTIVKTNDPSSGETSCSRAETFEVKFGDGFLGIEFVINETRREVMVRSVQPDAWSKNVLQIPPNTSITRGLIVDAVNGKDVSLYSAEEALDMLQYSQRPLTVRFRKCESSMVVCKLCECRVDAWSLDEHTNYCVMSRRFELEADQINNALSKLATSIKANLQSEALRSYFHPEELHFYNALRVIAIQASSCDVSSVESFALCSRLIKMLDRIREQEPDSASFAVERGLKYCSRIRNLIHAKMSKMRQTQKVMLQQGPNDGRAPFQRTKSLEEVENVPVARPSATSVRKPSACRVSIRDFHIVKPISKGAFGKVYLARKKTTGDQYAIKVLAKEHIVRKKQIQHIETERDILVNVESPFVVKLFWTFQTKRNLFLVMEYLPGGDFMSLLECIVQLEEQVARVYIAEVALALNHLHLKGCVHRDLKPDNILISSNGHIKLTDFGLSEEGVFVSDSESEYREDGVFFYHSDQASVEDDVVAVENPERLDFDDEIAELLADDLSGKPARRNRKREVAHTYGRCGTPDYLSPEIILGQPHGPPVDYWALGVILYEMLVGFPPFNDETVEAIFDNILKRQILWPDGEKCLSMEAMDLINQLLEPDPVRRLGWEGLQRHPFFLGIDWNTLLESTPPFVPTLEGPNDTSYFNNRNLTDVFIDDDDFDIDARSMDSSSPDHVGSQADGALQFRQLELLANRDGSASLLGDRSHGSMDRNPPESTNSSVKTELDPSLAGVDPLFPTSEPAPLENNLKFPSGMYSAQEQSDIAEAFRSFSYTNMNALAAASRTEAELIADTRLSEVDSSSALSILI